MVTEQFDITEEESAPQHWIITASDELCRLDTALKQSTAIAIAENKMLGHATDTAEFWHRLDVCARSTYNKWKKDDPIWQEVLDNVILLAMKHRTIKALEGVDEAATLLQINAPAFAQAVIQIAQGGYGVKPSTQLQAAFGGLDRASVLTADKTNHGDVIVNMDDYKKNQDAAEKELAEWEQEQYA